MAKEKLTYQELEDQVAELKKQNEILRLHSSFQNEEESEKYFLAILNNIGDPVFLKDDQSRLLLVNDAFCEIFDLPRSNIIGKTLTEHIPFDERESFLKIDKQVLADGQESTNEETLNVKGRQTRIISTRKSRFIDSNGKKFLVGIIRDITESKKAEDLLIKSEEKYRELIQGLRDAVYRMEIPSGKYTIMSPAAKEIFSYDSKEFIENPMLIKEIIAPGWEDYFKEKWADCLKGQIPATYEYEIIDKNGKLRWIHQLNKAIFDVDKKIIAIEGSCRDITENKNAKQILIERKNQLRSLNATKDKLFSIIAHDLRSPFNGILGLTDLLIKNLRSFDIDKTEKMVTLINTSTKNTLTLLDNLLAWAKTQTGQINFNPEKIVLSKIIEEVIETSDSSAKIKNISINQIQSDNITVSADFDMLETILRNLITNAIKFSNPNSEIDIYSTQTNNQIEITVSDNGVGIDKDTVNKLFNLNEKITTVGTANEKGSGIGLSLSKEFVKKHGGEIWVESELDKGSDFKFTLPLS